MTTYKLKEWISPIGGVLGALPGLIYTFNSPEYGGTGIAAALLGGAMGDLFGYILTSEIESYRLRKEYFKNEEQRKKEIYAARI